MNNLHNTFNDQEHQKVLEEMRQRAQQRMNEERQVKPQPKE